MIRNFLLLPCLIFFFISCRNEKQGADDKAIFVIKPKEKRFKIKNVDIVELRDGTSIKYKILSKDEYESLLKDTIGSALTKPYSIEVYCMKDMRVLAKCNEDYALYHSMSDLDRIITDFANDSSEGNEALMNKNKYGDTFPSNTNLMINELLDSLHIKYKGPSEELLQEIDECISRLRDPNIFMKEYFMNIIAVVGETLIKKYNGVWKMKLGTDAVTWNPFLRVKEKEVGFFIYLYDDIFLSNVQKKNVLFEIYQTTSDIIRLSPAIQ